MTRAQRLQQEAIRAAAAQDAAVERFELELRRVWVATARQLRRALASWETDPDGRTVTTAANLGRVLGLRRRVREWLSDAGYDDLIARSLGDDLDALASAAVASSRVAGQALRFAPADVAALEAWRALRLADLLDLGTTTARAVQRAALDGLLGLRPLAALVGDLADVLDLSTRQARTIYDTAVTVYSRQLDLMGASGAADELFFFAGPVDEVLRPFCRARVGKVFTRAAIEAMDNGQLPDVLLTGGGYNCRHTFKRVSVLDDELRALAESGQRAPWVVEQMRRAA